MLTVFVSFFFQAYEFFLFAGLMFLDMAIFAVLAYYYKYNYFSSGGTEENKEGDVDLPAIEESSNKEGGQVNPSYKDD